MRLFALASLSLSLQQPYDARHDSLYRAYLIFTVIGVIGALFGIFVIWKQTKATTEAARAAKASADAVINAERAWIVVELHPGAYLGADKRWYRENGVQFNAAEVLAGRHLVYSLRIRNRGRTPAQILSYQMAYSCLLEGAKDLTTNKSAAVYQEGEFNCFLANDDPIEILPPFDVHSYMEESWTEICELKKTGVFHGWVKYRHMFSTTKECQSDYCYVYTPSLQRLTMVGRHTKYT